MLKDNFTESFITQIISCIATQKKMRPLLGIIIVVLILLLVWYWYTSKQVSNFTVLGREITLWGKAPPAAAVTASPTAVSQGAPMPLNCRSPETIAATKKFYDTTAEYHGVFVMDPISSMNVDDLHCDFKYRFIPTPNSPRNDVGVDFRRFTYRYVDDHWEPVLMGDWKSGTLIV